MFFDNSAVRFTDSQIILAVFSPAINRWAIFTASASRTEPDVEVGSRHELILPRYFEQAFCEATNTMLSSRFLKKTFQISPVRLRINPKELNREIWLRPMEMARTDR